MSNITLRVEFLAGTDIKSALVEAKEKAKLLNVAYIKFNFNGIEFSIGQNAHLEYVLSEWEQRSEENLKYGIVSA